MYSYWRVRKGEWWWGEERGGVVGVRKKKGQLLVRIGPMMPAITLMLLIMPYPAQSALQT